MAYGYKEINDVDLAWRENRENISLQGRQLLRRVLNQVLSELDKQFIEGLNNGKILEINPGKKELMKLLSDSAQAQQAQIEQNVSV